LHLSQPSDFETEIDLKDKIETPKRSISIKGCGSSAGAKAYSVEGKRNNNIMLNSDHKFYICNDTNKVRQFKVYTKYQAMITTFQIMNRFLILRQKNV
jgi:hypothetical protein